MSAGLAAAEIATREGRGADAMAELAGALTEDPALPVSVYIQLARQLYQARRYSDAERWAVQGLAVHGDVYELWNLRGAVLRVLQQRSEALAAFDRAIAIGPRETGARINRGNLLLDMADARAAVTAFSDLVAEAPGDALMHLNLARALAASSSIGHAAASFRRALEIAPHHLETWRQFARVINDARGADGAEAILEEGLAANPDAQPLLEAKALILRTAAQPARTAAFLEDVLARHPGAAWAHFHLGDLIVGAEPARGLQHLQRAVALDENNFDHILALVQALQNSQGPEEGAHLELAHNLAQRALALGAAGAAHTTMLSYVFSHVCAFESFDALGDFKSLGRSWAAAGMPAGLIRQMSRVNSHADRLELLEQHRIWGRWAEQRAAAAPVARTPRGVRSKIRLGIVSSDLRSHVVTRFAQPIFDHQDRDRFELYAYSFFEGAADSVQTRIAGQVSEFRWRPGASTQAAAQMIADDSPDMLIELGGVTKMNKPEVMARRLAPLQASWLGYPHSLGLSTVDRLICDRFNAPTDRALMVEDPLMLPDSWVVLGPSYTDDVRLAETSAEDRHGFLTFGTANGAYKYTRASLRTWARIVARVPGSRFAFVRPEAASATFRRNVLAQFAAEGVGEDRVIFHAIRGAHLPFYELMDVSLDTFPLTGGTTTIDSLWMGVPVVSLSGAAFFERLSHSILSNVGLGDLCAASIEDYVDTAVRLAGDRETRAALRVTLRQTLRASPLGQTEAWAGNFYDALAGAVESHSAGRHEAGTVGG